MEYIQSLADPKHVARFQRFCGVIAEKPETRDQHTQTLKSSTDDSHQQQGDELWEDIQHCQTEVNKADIIFEECRTRKKLATNNNDYIKSKIQDKLNQKCNGISEIEENFINKSNSLKNGYDKTEIIHSCNGHSFNHKKNCHMSAAASDDTTPPVKTPVKIKYKSLLYLAHFGAFLGNEEFYLTFFPFCLWNLDGVVIRQVAWLWCVVMYLGQATKDYLRWPRPPCPPVVRLETHYLQEYSMPSTHAMAGTAIPVYLVYMVMDRYQVPFLIPAIIAVLWFTTTCLSRLYLGVHTILDLLVGFVYAVLIVCSFTKYVEAFDMYQQTNITAAPVMLLMSLALCTVCYPSNYKNSSKGDAIQIVASLTGVGIGQWFSYQLGLTQAPELLGPYTIEMPTLMWFWMALVRFVTGGAVLALIYLVTRWLSIRFFSSIFGLDKPDKTFPSVMIAYKFTTYCLVGAGISFIVPVFHLYFGIHRPAIFYELS